MRKRVFNVFRWSMFVLALLSAHACAEHTVKLVHPRTGAVAECSSSGLGAGSAWAQGYLDDCIRRMESRGYARLDKLTPEQRQGLESQGLLPKGDATP
jgi:hypothetical protein